MIVALAAIALAQEPSLVRAAEVSDEPGAWFLAPLPALVPGLVPLGPLNPSPCAGALVDPASLEQGGRDARAQLDDILPDDAYAAYEALAPSLPCLAEPLAPEALAEFQYRRGIAALTKPQRDTTLGRAAFEAAITANPDIAWDEQYAAFARSVFFEAKVTLLQADRARVWVLPGTRVWLEGRELGTEVGGTSILAGRHLAHLQIGDERWRGVVDIPPGGRVVLGDPASVWGVVVGPAETDAAIERAFAVRSAVAAANGGAVEVARPGATAVLAADGTLGPWSDEGPYKPRLRLFASGGWLLHERTIESPPVDIPSPSSHWGLSRVGFAVQFHPVLRAELAGGLAVSGPFQVADQRLHKLMGAASLGVAAEWPEGWLRPGARLDLALFLPGRNTIGGIESTVVLAGPLLTVTGAARITDVLWLQAEVGGGWVGTETVHAGGRVELRLPPFGS